jgi:hypothetical protein
MEKKIILDALIIKVNLVFYYLNQLNIIKTTFGLMVLYPAPQNPYSEICNNLQ